ncbi:hypothetical protein BZB76_4531 [Actinomadura pelletieri DSM 43383]|uniref:Uncharacterized protein n=1 Tax=Actinomadura pelletieri DSM 43383 TaxID=1120940 RepID=A0A495QIA1_9ACTN|nr:hypothetical protein [Actinomadura pelletieri]RKS71724.1 hypothetical protein BZB76_4531 [Actinomadura pelletieri DSM 43383]
MATTVDQRTKIVVHGVVYPKDPRDMTAEEVREHLFLPEEAGIEVLDHQDEGTLTEVGISWAEGVDDKTVLYHLRRIIRERMIHIV